MDYEKKYKEAEKLYQTANADQRYVLESLFPKLRESEDEKVRKEIMEYVKNTPVAPEGHIEQRVLSRWLAWLEKQGKSSDQIHYWTEEEIGPIISDYLRGDEHYGGMIERLICLKPKSLEKQGEQKPANKIEPQFKPGDWIVNNDDDSVGQITKIIEGEDGFAYEHTNGYFHGIFEKDFHLWTIQDAKDGDFLACPLPEGRGEQVFIFKEIGNRSYVDNCIEYYCRVCQDVFYENTTGYMGTASDEFKPATWEQRYLLIRKMKEAGYEWNPDAKVLKKIKRKSQRMVSAETKGALLNESEREALRTEYEKGRADAIAEMPKPVWSEEDKINLQGIIDEIEANKNNAPDYDLATYDRFLSWLKSLKDRVQPQNRWKPTIAQVKAVEEVLNDAGYTYDDLKSLYDDLKKL